MKKIVLAAIMISVLRTSFPGQESDPPPGSIKLLPGYKHQTERAIDSTVGKIWRDGGPTIRYDIGTLAGEYVIRKDRGKYSKYSWYREQTLGKHIVRLALKKDGQLMVTYPDSTANFT